MPNEAVRAGSSALSPVAVTVVIPHYNHSHILPRAVASVLAERMPGVEIIIVDDGSTENCEDVLAALEAADPSVRVIRCEKNQGAPAALNVGLAAARGEFVNFLGADDLLIPGFLRTMADALREHPDAALACGDIVIASTDSRVLGVRPFTAPAWGPEYLSPAMVRRRIRETDNWICNTATLHRTEIIRGHGGFDSALGSFCDGILCRLLVFRHGFVYVPGISGIWQVAANTLSASSVLNSEKLEHLLCLARQKLAGSVVGATAPEYVELYERRLRMSAVRTRLLWKGKAANAADILQAAKGDDLDRRVVGWVDRRIGLNRIGGTLVMSWFTIRRRPFNPLTLLVHAVRNRMMLRKNEAAVGRRLLELNAAGAALSQRVAPAGAPVR